MKFLFAFLLAACAPAADRLTDRLNVYFIDVEGGQSTLIVASADESHRSAMLGESHRSAMLGESDRSAMLGESHRSAMLIDAGWNDRDALRIQRAIRAAGVTRLDYLLLTHYHRDHAGGVPALVKLVPVANFLDHGANTDLSQGGKDVASAYEKAAAGSTRRAVHPGDRIALGGAAVTVLSGNGRNISSPLKEGGVRNPLCGTEQAQPDEVTENAQSLGVVIAFGKFRLLDLGDILWKQEIDLACPADRIGPVDAYVVTHHGKFTSGPATLVHAVAPRAAIMNNATDKGGSPETFQILKKSPGLRDIWQLHASTAAGALNSAEDRIANPEKECSGFGFLLSAADDGSFQITNQRTGKSERYAARNR